MSQNGETLCLVVYDVVEDRIRQKISDAYLDYGLERFQFSAFSGRLDPTRRRELFLKLKELLGSTPGRILLQPISDDDVEKQLVFQQQAEDGSAQEKGDAWPEPGAPRPTILKF
jgi:CRISPR-associated protein Cas2